MTKIQAHRGASYLYPDNTMIAFKNAYKLGADGIELDVYTLFDNTVIVCHDNWIYRGEEKRSIFLYDKQSIKKEYAYSKFEEYKKESIPYLEEVLDFFKDKDMLLNVEIKPDSLFCHIDTVGEVMQLMQKYKMEEKSIISSFNHRFLVDITERFPKFRTGVLYSEDFGIDMIEYCKAYGFDALHTYYPLVTEELVKRAHQNGIMVNPWTINDRDDIKRFIQYGVDYIISDDVHAYKEALWNVG